MLFRASIMHTPKNPFTTCDALEVWQDGALLVQDGKIQEVGDFAELQQRYPEQEVQHLAKGILIPGMIDTHVHFPQVRLIGALGLTLLDWLDTHTLPQEVRLQDPEYAATIAREFVDGLLSAGTTTALVFGAHFKDATAKLFDEAEHRGMQVISGVIVSDRLLKPELHTTPEQAYHDAKELIAQYHGKDRLRYAVTPRFSLSASEGILEACSSVMQEHQDVHFTSHINENNREIATVLELFPWATDYLHSYEKFGLLGKQSVLAHNCHASDSELGRMADSGSSSSHCPCSNAALGSGFFSMKRHLQAGVHFALGSDVGGGTGFSLLKEGLQAYFLQRLSDGYDLSAAHLLYLATQAGAEALHLPHVGHFAAGMDADMVHICPPENSALDVVLSHAKDSEHALSSIFALGSPEAVKTVWLRGNIAHQRTA